MIVMTDQKILDDEMKTRLESYANALQNCIERERGYLTNNSPGVREASVFRISTYESVRDLFYVAFPEIAKLD